MVRIGNRKGRLDKAKKGRGSLFHCLFFKNVSVKSYKKKKDAFCLTFMQTHGTSAVRNTCGASFEEKVCSSSAPGSA